MKKIMFIMLMVFSFFVMAGCNRSVKADIYATVYPVEFIVKEIVKDEFSVTNVYPRGSNVHDYELSIKSIANMTEAKAIFYIGLNLEPAICNGINTTFKNVNTVALTKDMAGLMTGSGHDHLHEGHVEDDNVVKYYDPHVWTDPIKMIHMANIVRDELILLKPEKESFFRENASALIIKLSSLDEELSSAINDINVQHKIIMVDHNAYNYWTRYGLEILKTRQTNDTTDVSPAEFQATVNLAREHNIKYVITTKNEASNEELINKIVREIGGEKVDMHNLSTITINEYKSEENYFTIMENNIKVLQKVLPKKE